MVFKSQYIGNLLGCLPGATYFAEGQVELDYSCLPGKLFQINEIACPTFEQLTVDIKQLSGETCPSAMQLPKSTLTPDLSERVSTTS